VTVNVATAREKKSLFFLNPFFKLLPATNVERILLWACLPACLLLLELGITYLKPSFFTHFFPFLTIISVGLIFRYRSMGLATSYLLLLGSLLFLFRNLAPECRLWQIALLFTYALNLFILLLCVEEVTDCLEEISAQTGEFKKKWTQAELDLLSVQKTAEEREREFRDEIERLKSEAEQRRIERVNDWKKFDLIQSEIELLTSQKDEFVEESQLAQESALKNLQALEEQKKAFESEEKQLKKELIAAQEALLTLQQLPVQTTIIADSSKIKQALAQTEGALAQLRIQFAEKSQILSQTRKELFQTEGKLLVLQRELVAKQSDPNREEALLLEKMIMELIDEIEQQEKEITELEALILHVLSQ
jgi:hypothetical protein